MYRTVAALLATLMICVAAHAGNATSSCAPGTYRADNGDALALTRNDPGAGRISYGFVDGRRGVVSEARGPVRCHDGIVLAQKDGETAFVPWRRIDLRETPTHFRSHGLLLKGMLIEPPGASSATPLVVFVHGSEKTGWVGHMYYPYLFAAQGISAFVYDKRGTGGSEGHYTQNFNWLADDVVAASREARRLAGKRYGRFGLWGGSQGGWVAPAAANRARADFVVVAFGIILSPLEEDNEQVYDELRRRGYGKDVIARAHEVTAATDAVMASHFTKGFAQLAAVKRKYAGTPWLGGIEGEFTGDLLRTDEATLRKEGRAKFDNVNVIWRYDAQAVLRRMRMPQLWVLAGQDREAPNRLTRKRLRALVAAGEPIDVAVFPHTDHGVFEFTTDEHGERHITRHPQDFFPLMAAWIKGKLAPPYPTARFTSGSGANRTASN